MNLKKIEKEMEKLFYHIYDLDDMPTFRGQFRDYKRFKKKVIKILSKNLKQLIKQVIESVPVEEDKTKDWFSDYVGYNRHVQEIKQWKKKVLRELEEK